MNKAHQQIQEPILQSCLEQLRALPPVQQAQLVKPQDNAGEKSALPYDVQVNVTFKTGGRTAYLVQLKGTLSRVQAEQTILQAHTARHKGKRQPMLIMARYVNPSLAGLLQESRVPFVDVAGNASLAHPTGAFIWVIGKRPPQLRLRQRAGAAFGANGTKILYVLLKDPRPADWRYRTIAQQADVALGTVSRVLADLKAAGFLEPVGSHQFKLIHKRKLLDRWVQSYSERLRPKLVLGTFRTPCLELSEVARALERLGTAWAVTGDQAADLLTGVLKGGRLTVMTEGELGELAKKLRLMPSRDENIEMLRLFSRAALMTGVELPYPVAHPLLVYAELIHSGGDREREAAQVIYERHIAKLVETT